MVVKRVNKPDGTISRVRLHLTAQESRLVADALMEYSMFVESPHKGAAKFMADSIYDAIRTEGE